MTDAPAPLERDRNLGRLLDDTVALYRRHAAVALLLAAAVVIPVELLVSGLGLGQLTSGYSSNPGSGELVFGALVPVLVTTPLVTGMIVRVVLDDAAGERASAGRAAETGLKLFGPLLAAVVLATVGIMLGFVAFVIPGIWLAVRWVVVAPTVIVEDRRGADALRRSAALVAGNWWWAFGVMIVLGILVLIVSAVVSIPTEAIGRSVDAQAIVLLGAIIGQILTLPFSALATTLLFFTLRARRGEGAAPAGRDAFGHAAPRAEDPFGHPAADRDAPPPLWGPRDEDPAPAGDAPAEDEPPRWRTPAPSDERGDEPPPERLPGGWEPPVPPR